MSAVYDQHALSPRLWGRFPMDRCPATMTIKKANKNCYIISITEINQSMGRLHVDVVSRLSPGVVQECFTLTRYLRDGAI